MNRLFEFHADCLAEGKAEGRTEVLRAISEQLFYEVPEPPACDGIQLMKRGKKAISTLVELRDDCLAKGKAMGRAEVFLAIAEQMFNEVPEHLVARVDNASAKQIHAWVEEMQYAPDLESLINGSEMANGESCTTGSHGEIDGMDRLRAEIWTDMWMENLTKDYAEALLEMAEQQFGEIPEHLAARVDNAPVEQIQAWFKQLPNAPDFKSVINEAEIEEREMTRLYRELESVFRAKHRQYLHRAKQMRISGEMPD